MLLALFFLLQITCVARYEVELAADCVVVFLGVSFSEMKLNIKRDSGGVCAVAAVTTAVAAARVQPWQHRE